MKKRIYSLVSLLLLSMLAVFMVSCKKEEAKESDYNRIKIETKELKVLISPENPPFEYEKEGQIVGADIALIERIASQIGVEYKLVEKNYADLMDALIAGEGDIVVSAYIYNKERDGVDFSNVYLDNSLALVTLKSEGAISSTDDMAGKIIAVQENSQSDFYISDFSNLKSIERCSYVSECMDMLNNGDVDAVICDINTATYYLKQDSEKYSMISLRDTLEKYVVAVRKGSDLLSYVNGAVSSYKNDEDIEKTIIEHTVHVEEAPVDDTGNGEG